MLAALRKNLRAVFNRTAALRKNLGAVSICTKRLVSTCYAEESSERD
jgi:hypothetical protein